MACCIIGWHLPARHVTMLDGQSQGGQHSVFSKVSARRCKFTYYLEDTRWLRDNPMRPSVK